MVNATESSITFQWQSLTDVLGNQVLAYVPLLETTSGEKKAVNIVLLNVTSMTVDGLRVGTEYRAFVVAVDALGRPHKSLQLLTSTEEDGECGEDHTKLAFRSQVCC